MAGRDDSERFGAQHYAEQLLSLGLVRRLGEAVTTNARQDEREVSLDEDDIPLFEVRAETPPARRALEEIFGLDAGHTRVVTSLPRQDAQLTSLLRLLTREVEQGYPLSQTFSDHLIHSVITCVLRSQGSAATVYAEAALPSRPGRLSARTLRDIDEHIRLHLDHAISLDELAAVAHLSKFHFIRSFRESTGYTPYEYLIRRRVERARDLLINNPRDVTLSHIATLVGFYDQSHLNRHFKRVTGTTPRQFLGAVVATQRHPGD